jgi:hypothetical protein
MMPAFSQDFRAMLLEQPQITDLVGTRIHVGAVPEEIEPPYLWLQRAGVSHERVIDQRQGEEPFEQRWDLECVVADPADLEPLANAVQRLDCLRGKFGDATIQGLFVEDQQDDYVPKGVYSDEGLDVAAFAVTVYGYLPPD